MKQTLLIVLFLISCGYSVLAQTGPVGLYFERSLVERSMDASQSEIRAVTRIVNPSDRTLEVRWYREVNDLPVGWSSVICDTIRCYRNRIDSATFAIKPRSSYPLEVKLAPGPGSGDAQVTVRVAEVANPRNSAVATFSFPQPVVNKVRGADIRLFPNPGIDDFKVISEEVLMEVRLVNMLGRTVKVFPGHLEVFDVRDLPNGIYLVSMVGQDGRVVKTLRFSKRTVAP